MNTKEHNEEQWRTYAESKAAGKSFTIICKDDDILFINFSDFQWWFLGWLMTSQFSVADDAIGFIVRVVKKYSPIPVTAAILEQEYQDMMKQG